MRDMIPIPLFTAAPAALAQSKQWGNEYHVPQ